MSLNIDKKERRHDYMYTVLLVQSNVVFNDIQGMWTPRSCPLRWYERAEKYAFLEMSRKPSTNHKRYLEFVIEILQVFSIFWSILSQHSAGMHGNIVKEREVCKDYSILEEHFLWTPFMFPGPRMLNFFHNEALAYSQNVMMTIKTSIRQIRMILSSPSSSTYYFHSKAGKYSVFLRPTKMFRGLALLRLTKMFEYVRAQKRHLNVLRLTKRF